MATTHVRRAPPRPATKASTGAWKLGAERSVACSARPGIGDGSETAPHLRSSAASIPSAAPPDARRGHVPAARPPTPARGSRTEASRRPRARRRGPRGPAPRRRPSAGRAPPACPRAARRPAPRARRSRIATWRRRAARPPCPRRRRARRAASRRGRARRPGPPSPRRRRRRTWCPPWRVVQSAKRVRRV